MHEPDLIKLFNGGTTLFLRRKGNTIDGRLLAKLYESRNFENKVLPKRKENFKNKRIKVCL